MHAKLSICALAGLVAFGSVQAASSSVQIEHVRVQLVDLDTSDGITPTFTVTGKMTTVRVFEQYTQVGTMSAPVGPFSAGNANVSSTAGSFGGDLFSDEGWSAAASSASHIVGRGGDATVHLEVDFTLTPNTLLLVTTDAPALQAESQQYEFAFADAELTLNGAGKYFSRAYAAETYYPDSTFALQASFANLASAAVYGAFDLKIRSHTFTVGAPVPEPQTAALLMAGLVITGVALRRRRRS
jgi:hypothetical protein